MCPHGRSTPRSATMPPVNSASSDAMASRVRALSTWIEENNASFMVRCSGNGEVGAVVELAAVLDNRQINMLTGYRFESLADIAQARHHIIALENASLDCIGKGLFGGRLRVAHRHSQRIDASRAHLGGLLGKALLDQPIELFLIDP